MQCIQRVLYSCLISIFFTCGSFSASFGQDSTYYNQVEDSLINEPKALSIFYEKEIKKYPQSQHVLLRLGRSYLMTESFTEAEQTFRTLLTLDKACGYCHLGFSHIEMDRNNLDNAMEQINAAITINDKNKTYYLHRSNVFMAMNRMYAAEDDLNKAISLEPGYFGSYFQRAQYYKKTDRLLSAISDLEKSVELNPGFQESVSALCQLYMDTDQPEKVISTLNRIIQQQPDETAYYHMRAQAYIYLRQWDSALKDIKSIQAIHPDDYRTHQLTGYIKYQMEDMDGACTEYETAQKLLQQRNDIDAAYREELVATMEDFCNINKASYFYQRGIAAFNHEKFTDAIRFYDEGLKRFPDNSMMLSFKANALLRLQSFEAAIEYYTLSNAHFKNYENEINLSSKYRSYSEKEKASYLAAVFSMNIFSIAECYYYQGAYEQALRMVDSALVLYPAYKPAAEKALFSKDLYLFLKGKILLDTDHFDDALLIFNEILKNTPDNPEVQLFKAAALFSKESGKPETVRSYGIGIHYQQTTFFRWKQESQPKSNVNQAAIEQALQLCDEVIRQAPEFALAYYIRGQIKWFRGYPDYCYDLVHAQKINPQLDISFAQGCR